MTASIRRGLLWTVTILSLAIALTAYRYLAPGMPGGAPNVIANRLAHPGVLVVHASLAATALLLGSFQFYAPIRRRWPRVHRWMGRIYVTSCMIGGVAGFILALGATTGPISTAGFGSLALIWLFCTGQAYRYARARDFVRHERWMIRSFALTFGAVTLRLYLPIAMIIGLDFNQAYRAISFLAWVPNLAFAEWLIASRLRTSRPLAAASHSPG